MGVRLLLAMVLFINAVAEEDTSIKYLCNDCIEDDEAISKIETETQTTDQANINTEKSGTPKPVILFKPYIPEGQNHVEGINTNITSTDLKHRIFTLTRKDGRTVDIDSIKSERKTNNQNVTKVQKESIKGDYSSKNEVTSKPFARYEITENVMDVPDDRTPAGPVVTNYTPYRNTPLNLGTPQNTTEVKNEIGDGDENNKNTRSRFSILHINAEYDEKPVNNQSKISTFFKGVKQYISGIKSEVVNGINKLFHKHDDVPHGKDFNDSHDDSDDDDDDDDFGELHRTLHKGFK